MNLIDELKALHADSLNPSPGDDERRDSSENFNFIYALADAWPKLLAVVQAAKISLDLLDACEPSPTEPMREALKALEGVGE